MLNGIITALLLAPVATIHAAREPERIKPGSRCDYAGLNFDLFSTFLEVAGGVASADLDAISLVPMLKGGEISTPRDLYFVQRGGATTWQKPKP